MNALAKTGIALGIAAAVMVAASSTALYAQSMRPAAPAASADRTLVAETRPITAQVAAVESNGSIDVTVRPGSAPSLTVRAEKRLMGNIVTVQDGATLRIETRGVMQTRQPIQVEIVVPQLTRLATHGSGDAHAAGFSGNEIEVSSNGSGDVELRGQYRTVRAGSHGSGDITLDAGNSALVDLSVHGSGDMNVSGRTAELRGEVHGSGDIDAARLQADSVSLRSNGSGDVRVQARQKIDVTINGSGDVHVTGQPTARAVSRNGSGEVHWD